MWDTAHLELWGAFCVIVIALLALDLAVFNRHAHAVDMRAAAAWSAAWVGISLVFCGGIWWLLGREQALQFLTGYLIEKSLSIDNLFVFLVIFSYFGVEARYQHRVLYWGVIGAIVLRAVMILVGATLVARFHWLLYVFGAFLVYTGYRLAVSTGETVHPERNLAVRAARRLYPVTSGFHGESFFVRVDGRRLATPLLVVLLTVETTDVMFALDSIPAIFGVTSDPFILLTSNIFAILGLRALYFLLAGVMDRFHHLRHGLALVLVFVGLKMLAEKWVHVPTHVSLAVVTVILAASVTASLRRPRRRPGPDDPPHA